jgi:hypothetical protein
VETTRKAAAWLRGGLRAPPLPEACASTGLAIHPARLQPCDPFRTLSRLVMYSVLISEQYSARAGARAAGIGGVQLGYRLSLYALPQGPLADSWAWGPCTIQTYGVLPRQPPQNGQPTICSVGIEETSAMNNFYPIQDDSSRIRPVRFRVQSRLRSG